MHENIHIDFIGVGVEKAGTTWLGQCLAEHPEICFSSQKEVCFFNKNYIEGVSFYKQFFENCVGEKIYGEYTPGYFYNDEVPQRIKNDFPEAKLIFSFRSPVERAYSEYKDLKAHGRIDSGMSFSEAVKQQEVLVKHSLYSRRLKRYLELFPSNQIHIIIYKDIVENPGQVIKELYEFLNVDTSFVPQSLESRIHQSTEKRYRYFFVARGIRKVMSWGRQAKDFWWGRILVRFLTVTGFKKLIQKVFRLNRVDKKGPNKQQNFEEKPSFAKYFREDIKRLEDLLNRNLDFWYY